jgi:kynurenine formamidase
VNDAVRLSIDPAAAVDLSFPIDPHHFRWRHERELVDRLRDGAPFETSRFAMSAHAFTHADAPSHVAAGAHALHEVPVSTWVGTASVLDLSDIAPGAPIGADQLARAARRAPELVPGDIVLLRTDWDRRRDIATPDYWHDAPWVDRSGAEWLAGGGPRAVGFDFPQDEPIRRTLAGEPGTPPEFVTHDVLLRSGIGLIEYLHGLDRLPARVLLVAAPIALVGSDGGPTRALAFPLTAPPHGHGTTTERQP